MIYTKGLLLVNNIVLLHLNQTTKGNKMTITTIEATINAQIADLEKAWLSNIKNNDQDRIKGCEFALIELNILLNTFKQAA